MVDYFSAFYWTCHKLNTVYIWLLRIRAIEEKNILLPADHHDLQKPEDVQKLNSFYLDLLVHAVNRNHGASSSRVLVDIFRMVPLLAEVNRMQREIIGSLKIDNPPFKK